MGQTSPELQQGTIDHVPPTVEESSCRDHFLSEDFEAQVEMMIKGRDPHIRHVSRTHRVNLDWLFE